MPRNAKKAAPPRLIAEIAADPVSTVVAASPTWPHVLAFARLMERKLEANRHKGDRKGWLKDPPTAIFKRLLEEVEELRTVFNRPWGQTTTAADDERQLRDLMGEAADVGNFAMMLVDCCAWAADLGGESGIIEAEARRAS